MSRLEFHSLSDPDAVMRVAAARRDATLFGLALALDPRARDHFLRVAGGLDDLDPVAGRYACLYAAARKAGRGQIDPADPWPTVRAVITRRARKAAARAAEARNPRISGPGAAGRRGRLVGPVDVSGCAGPRLESEAEERGWTAELAAVNRELEGTVDPVDLAVFRAVAAFVGRHGGRRHGGLMAVAATARVGADGRLVLMDDRPAVRAEGPDWQAYRAVRRAYQAAHAAVVRVLRARGIDVPAVLA